jgi:hypothetical protein
MPHCGHRLEGSYRVSLMESGPPETPSLVRLLSQMYGPAVRTPKEPTRADFRYPDWVIRAPGLPSRRCGDEHSGQVLSDERIQANRSFSSNGLLR